MKDNLNIYSGLELNEKEKELVSLASDLSDLICKMIKRRIDMNLTQRDLAGITKIKQPMSARIESLTSIPRIDTLITILKALQMKLELKAQEEEEYEKIIYINISSQNIKEGNPFYLNGDIYKNTYINTSC